MDDTAENSGTDEDANDSAKIGDSQGTTVDAGETPQTEGRGSKKAVLEDLARERDKRQELEAQFFQLRDGLAAALGIDQGETPTPEQLTEQLAQAQAETKAAQLQLAVWQSMPDGVDREALLDSTSFRKAVSDATPDNIAATINQFVEDHPRFKTKPAGAGVRDLNTPATPSAPLDPIAAALTAAVGRRHA
ncbi:hypothetical protein FYJ43_04400 [Cutibacterium sp. WCA-380-WT-3A]|uniref:Scaffolding protein n=1 Tax=Cutibacterium porci TaxID=2605781 RepID=A0A7K0J6B1_9ACTN|nr:hypothetical protein [Cutibacterium porci]MSS45298.1 hypothetical protein [Cutibacterium porci]